jgi:hypothetical protein
MTKLKKLKKKLQFDIGMENFNMILTPFGFSVIYSMGSYNFTFQFKTLFFFYFLIFQSLKIEKKKREILV